MHHRSDDAVGSPSAVHFVEAVVMEVSEDVSNVDGRVWRGWSEAPRCVAWGGAVAPMEAWPVRV